LSRSWPAIAELADAFAPLSAVSLELLQIIWTVNLVDWGL
jgi:hypothetical protein